MKRILKIVLALLFPKFCVGCNEEGTWLCSKCRKKILKVVTQVCPQCGRVSTLGLYCKLCRYDTVLVKVEGEEKPKKKKKRKPLGGILTTAYFKEGPTREIIHHYKYNSVTELAKYLVPLMSETLKEHMLPLDIITYTPLFRKRLAERGYNQSEILAQGIGKNLKIDVENLLTKRKSTKRQVILKGKKRRENLKGVFKLRSKNNAFRHVLRIKGMNILIIDDITTTGATLNECAKVLKEAGANMIWGLVVARG